MTAEQFATAYALSTAIGLRAFMTLALASIAMHMGYLHPAPSFAWLGSNGATALLAVLAVFEFAGDKVPVVDHALHAVHFTTKPIAAALLVGSMVPEHAGSVTPIAYGLMAAGALDALGVHAAAATLRAGSTIMTAGVGNPLLSFVEDVLAIGGTVLAFIAPVVTAIGAVLLTAVALVIVRRVVVLTRRRI